MLDAIAQDIQRAIGSSRKWAETGWPTTFGRMERPVNSKKEAEALEKSFVYRLEAVSYWSRVEDAGNEAATWGERALASLKKGDIVDADDSLYFAVFLERPLRSEAPEWSPVYSKLKSLRAQQARSA